MREEEEEALRLREDTERERPSYDCALAQLSPVFQLPPGHQAREYIFLNVSAQLTTLIISAPVNITWNIKATRLNLVNT